MRFVQVTDEVEDQQNTQKGPQNSRVSGALDGVRYGVVPPINKLIWEISDECNLCDPLRPLSTRQRYSPKQLFAYLR